MIMELLGHKDYLRVLFALQRKPMRFIEIQKALSLNPTQVDRALRFLRKGLWIIPKTVPTEKGRVPVEYRLGKRGAAFLDSFETFSDMAQRKRSDLGPSVVAELRSLHLPA